ncbi:unnamed protein product [Meloidogyne enterolobii]|uniref:Uncharacterized protein n=1 Tax=Meloidogyne enterolobii TaxID=390850 RepID=A0ACB1A3H7_MELEN
MGDSSTLSASKEKEKSKQPQPSSTQIRSLEGGFPTLLVFVILGLAWLVGFASRLFAIVRFESIIHEFDPWFNYRSTQYMVENGFYNFLNWFDERAWYPLGRIVGGTIYPGLMLTSGYIHYLLSCLNIPVHIRDICVFLAPTFSRSVAGSYDNEGIAIFALQFTYFLWVRSVKTGSVFWAVLTALSYFYMVSAWGGYVFIINLIPLHVLVLVISGNYTNKIYIAYTTFYILGQLMAMQVPFVGFQPLVGALKFVQGRLTQKQFFALFAGVILFTFSIGILILMLLTYAGYVAPWTGRFYSLWDTGYAKIHIPIIASVSEHQPTTWVSFFFDLHITAAVFPAGLWFCVKNVNSERLFVILYAVTAVYFAGVMVRLMLTLTPVVCVLSGIAFSCIFEKYMLEDVEQKKAGEGKDLKDGMGATKSCSNSCSFI